MLTAPSFLSGLTPAELGVVKARIAQRANPALAQAKAEPIQALQDVEAGHRRPASKCITCIMLCR